MSKLLEPNQANYPQIAKKAMLYFEGKDFPHVLWIQRNPVQKKN